MAQVKMTQAFTASAEKIWETISAFIGIEQYVQAFSRSAMEGSGVGCTRVLFLKAGGEIHERLDALDPKAHHMTYSIITSPLPLDRYSSTMRLKHLGVNRSELEWSSRFEAKGVPEAEAVKLIEGVYRMGFEGLKRLHEN